MFWSPQSDPNTRVDEDLVAIGRALDALGRILEASEELSDPKRQRMTVIWVRFRYGPVGGVEALSRLDCIVI